MLNQTLVSEHREMYSEPCDTTLNYISLYTDTKGFKYILMTGMVAKLIYPEVGVDMFHAVRLSCHRRQIESSFYMCDFFCLYLNNFTQFLHNTKLSFEMYERLKQNTLSNLIYEKYKIPSFCKRSSIFKSTINMVLKQRAIHNFFVAKLFKMLST